MAEQGVKYPECMVQLSSGTDGNAVAIIMKVAREMKRHLVGKEGMDPAQAAQEAEAFKTEARSGDYDNVFATCHRWVTVI